MGLKTLIERISRTNLNYKACLESVCNNTASQKYYAQINDSEGKLHGYLGRGAKSPPRKQKLDKKMKGNNMKEVPTRGIGVPLGELDARDSFQSLTLSSSTHR